MIFEYLKVYKNGTKSVGDLDASSAEAAKTMIKKLAPCTVTIAAVYSLHGLKASKQVVPVANLDLAQLELIWEADK